jgi:anti-sigma regulatory factor (Ser/Thr protein kinase)
MREPLIFAIADRSQVGEARRQIVGLAERVGLSDVPREKVALLVNELGSNIVKHAGNGVLIARTLCADAGVEVLALDRGAGMADVEVCFGDGFSTAGSSGTGLGAVRRLASLVDVYSVRAGGTAIVAQVAAAEGSGSNRREFEVGAVWAPMTGEDICGDGWAVAIGVDGTCTVLLADGLGHGVGAAEAARTAQELFRNVADRPPARQLAALHDALRATRGAAASIARIDPRNRLLVYAGIGNIAGSIVSDAHTRQLVSLNGTLGHVAQRISEFTYPWPHGALLVMHSDGLMGRWDLDRYPGLAQHHPSLVAGVLYRDWIRGRDDVTVIAAREGRA